MASLSVVDVKVSSNSAASLALCGVGDASRWTPDQADVKPSIRIKVSNNNVLIESVLIPQADNVALITLEVINEDGNVVSTCFRSFP